MTGTITRVSPAQGYGLLVDEAGVERFIHWSQVHGTFGLLTEGQVVTFAPADGPQGPRADRVVPSVLFTPVVCIRG